MLQSRLLIYSLLKKSCVLIGTFSLLMFLAGEALARPLSLLFVGYDAGLTSALIAFLRTLVFQIAAVCILPLFWKLDGIWFSIIVAEVMAVLVAVLLLLVKRKKYQY